MPLNLIERIDNDCLLTAKLADEGFTNTYLSFEMNQLLLFPNLLIPEVF